MYFSQQPASSPPPASSALRRPWLIWFLGGIALIVVLCVIMAVIGGVRLFQGSQQDADAATQIIDQFMRAGTHNDPDAAVALFTPAADGSTPTRADLSKLFTMRADLFQNYQSVTQETYTRMTGTTGTILTMQGTLQYTTPPTKPFVAELHKVDDTWKIVSIRFPEGVGG